MKDTYLHKGLRKKLVRSLEQKGIKDERILDAIYSLPRHYFLDKAFEEHAYEDKAFPIGNKQTISQPYTVAYQTEMLQVKKRDRILEIGTGSGYQAGILALLGARVFTIERQENLYHKTRKFLNTIGLERIRMYFKDGYKGVPEFAPFDGIIITAGAHIFPEVLFQQLKVGGRMVIPIGEGDQKKMICYSKDEAGQLVVLEEGSHFRFVPFLEGTNSKKE